MLYPGHQVNSLFAVWCAVGLEGLFSHKKSCVFSSPINIVAIPAQLRGEFNGTRDPISRVFLKLGFKCPTNPFPAQLKHFKFILRNGG